MLVCLKQVGGALKDWDGSQFLSGMTQPVMILSGEDDEVSATSIELLRRSAPSATVKIFPGAASHAHIDAWQPFLETLEEFLSKYDVPQTAAAVATM
jgi:pimeloyl-ACP methyl ester carboxylesterase